MFPKYKLTEKQIRGIANIVLHEQGTIAGWFAEASQIANRTDIKGDSYATAENAVKTVTSGWYAKGKARYNAGTTNATVIEIVRRVFCDGYRTLPRYIDEHDCMSDISTVKNGTVNVKADKSKWKAHTTIIKNKMSSTYTFYDFPGGYATGVDPFGYTSKSYRTKWGDFCYTLAEARSISSKIVQLLSAYNAYITIHYKNFYNHYDSEMTTFAKAKSAVSAGKKVGLTCVVPLRWALAELGIKNASGKYLLNAPGGTFSKYLTGDMLLYFDRIKTPVGMTVIQAIDKKLLKAGDIVAYKGHEHVSTYSGSGYKFYEGGGLCEKNKTYPNGVLLDYSKNYWKSETISEVLRTKTSKKPSVPKTATVPITKTADVILTQARSWLGCKESDGSHKKIIDLYNKHKPLPRNYTVKYADAWCAVFVSACAIASGMSDIIPIECSCDQMIALAKKMGIWIENENRTPAPGEILMYDWQDSGSGDDKGSADHVGFVEKVTGKVITVIEGNYGNAVKRREIAVNGRYIRGYITPNYAGKQTIKEEPKVPQKAVQKLSGYTGKFPALPPRGYFKFGDGYLQYRGFSTQVKRVQQLINWINNGNIKVDGDYGNKTIEAVKKAQKALKVKVDGLFGNDTLAKARAYKK